MLVPITRQTFEQIIPMIATGPQYAYFWGKWQDVIRRLLISVVALTTAWLIGLLFGKGGLAVKLIFDIIAGMYWLWSPVYWASVRNGKYRRFPYSGFWRGRVLDAFITEELVKEEETVNRIGDLVVVENRERRLNLVVGDKSGFKFRVQSPLRRIYKVIKPGDIAEALLLSRQPDLNNIAEVTDVYLPSHNLWIGAYPCLRRDLFKSVSAELGGASSPQTKRRGKANRYHQRG